ncbi:hypothetical protein [Massilia sp. YMA4]|uniref:Uncharacterized protein n=1 Tax=[Empedobacter] haloabium TaxID=592317 RepID=A0ABZ1UGI4_9BURK|nr:hypothetical protein [Massilia sp. YMA4]AXA89819.1 hypothetical protein DPH57_00685 [Massilia sp. YMA4]
MKQHITAVVVASGLLLAGCATDEQKLVGRWKSAEPQQYWTFNADHTLVFADAKRAKQLSSKFLSPKMAAARDEDLRFTWALKANPDPNLLDIIVSYQDEQAVLNTIQEFSGDKAMRIGVPAPGTFEQADTIVNFTRP